MGGFQFKEVVGYDTERVKSLLKHLEGWVLRREKKDVLDLPPKVYTTLEVPLSQATWDMYKEMREDMITYLNDTAATASGAGVAAIRVAMLTSGILSGLERTEGTVEKTREVVSNEKVTALLDFLNYHQEVSHVLVWCRFTMELEQVRLALGSGDRTVCWVAGGQTSTQREAEIQKFNEKKRAILVGQPQAGGLGLNLAKASLVIYVSNDFNLVTRLQSEDRAHRIGQVNKVTYVDFLATSPDGKKTIDHRVLKALRAKKDFAAQTVDGWRRSLSEELDGETIR